MKQILKDSSGQEIIVDDDLTLLGPAVPQPPPPKEDLQKHMSPALRGTPGPSAGEGYLDSLERQRDVGAITQTQYDELMAHKKLPSKQTVDLAAIKAAFKQGFSR